MTVVFVNQQGPVGMTELKPSKTGEAIIPVLACVLTQLCEKNSEVRHGGVFSFSCPMCARPDGFFLLPVVRLTHTPTTHLPYIARDTGTNC